MKNYKIKKTLVIICVFILLIFVSMSVSPQDKSISEDGFHIYQSYIIGTGTDKRTSLRVIRYDTDIDIDDLFDRIRLFHDNMNGQSSELSIYLYDSNEDLLSGKKSAEKVYYVDDNY